MKKITRHLKNKTSSAIIVGGSLSGLMTGIAFAREGIHVIILEKAGENRGTGAGLRVDANFFELSRTARFLRKLVASGKRSVQQWSTIESSLRTEAKANSLIDLHYDARVKTVHQNEKTAWVVTDKGKRFYGDILVGADAHRSLVRAHIAPQKPHATFAGYMVWFVAIDENNLPKKHRPKRKFPEVTMLNGYHGFFFGSILPEDKNDSSSQTRRIGCTWYDNSRNKLLRRLGCVKGNIVHHSLKDSDIPERTLHELADEASKSVPEPWLSTIEQAINTRDITGIPIKEYMPEHLVKGRIALVGDAAHVPAPITASGFNASLRDAAVLGSCAAKGLQSDKAFQALIKYESHRLKKVQNIVHSGQSFTRAFGRK